MFRRRTGRFVVCLLACGCLAACVAKCADDSPANSAEELKKQLQRKVSFEFKDTPLEEAVAFILSLSKMNVVCQVEGDVRVTLKAQDLPLYDALTQIMEQAGLEFQHRSMALYIVKKGSPKPEVLQPLTPVASSGKKQLPTTVEQLIQMPQSFSFRTILRDATGAVEAVRLTYSYCSDEVFALATQIGSIKRVDLSCGSITPPAFSAIAKLQGLKELHIRGYVLGPAETNVPAVQALQSLPNLETLSFRYQRFSASALKELAKLRTVKALAINNAELSSEDVGTIAAMESVEMLDLSDNPLTDSCVKHLATMRHLKKVAGITDDAMAKLKETRPEIEKWKWDRYKMWGPAAWEWRFREKLQKKTTFEFVEVPLDEAFSYLRSLSGCNFVLDPALLKKPRTTNLKVTDITLEAALMQFMALNELCYKLRYEAMFVYDHWAFAGKPEAGPFNEPPEVTKALDALDTPVSFEFVDTPLEECAEFLESLAKQKFPCAGVEKPEVTVRVQDLKLGNALRWVAWVAGARIALKDGVLGFVKR